MRVSLLLTCLDTEECVVSFEPEGAVVTLKKGHPLRVEMSGPDGGLPELSYLPDGIVVGGWQGAQTRAWDEQGEELQL
jgi:hypothetical protein